jgi:hypothetical protein
MITGSSSLLAWGWPRSGRPTSTTSMRRARIRGVWGHFPSGRHLDRDATAKQLVMFRKSWDEAGLGYWTARLRQAGEFVGVGGCALPRGAAWNVRYRICREAKGNGCACELVEAAQKAAHDVRLDRPMSGSCWLHRPGCLGRVW